MSAKFKILSDFLIENKGDKVQFYEFVKNIFALNKSSFELYRNQFDQFIKNHNHLWLKKSRCRPQHFSTQYSSWLENDFNLKNPSAAERRKKPFEECSERTKKRRMEETRQNLNPEEVKGAYMGIVREMNPVDAEIIEHLSSACDETKNQILAVIRGALKPVKTFSTDAALALLVDLKLSKPQYELLRKQSIERNADLLPPYYRVADCKQKCYPPKDCIKLSDYGAEIELQALLDHTIQRIIETCDKKLFDDIVEPNFEACFKWGMDGASSQSLYKQVFENDSGDATDATVFMISLLPLQIKSSTKIIWTNPSPASPKLCRPIKFQFMKETPKSSKQEYNKTNKQIRKLKRTSISINGLNVQCSHKLFSTMVDGKMVNAVSDNNSNARCPICLAKPTQMNKDEELKKIECNEDMYAFGLSSLHCWIRFLECLLHIAYRLEFKKWSVTQEEHKKKAKDAKERIQLAFKKETGKPNFYIFRKQTLNGSLHCRWQRQLLRKLFLKA